MNQQQQGRHIVQQALLTGRRHKQKHRVSEIALGLSNSFRAVARAARAFIRVAKTWSLP